MARGSRVGSSTCEDAGGGALPGLTGGGLFGGGGLADASALGSTAGGAFGLGAPAALGLAPCGAAEDRPEAPEDAAAAVSCPLCCTVGESDL